MMGTQFGNFEVVEPLRKEGMGMLFIARHHKIGLDAVVEVMAPELTARPGIAHTLLL